MPAQRGSQQGTRKEGESMEKPRKYRKVIKPGGAEEGGGVSKIKAALRQTRRLLAKEKLSASVRQEAERKLVALEDDLKTKEMQQKEKNNAQRYHKVRFFERQKLVRKIKKLKRAKEESSEGVEEELFEARALLNYVLHYPMTQKYVALFPRQGPSDQDEVEETEREASSSDDKAAKVKARIIESMKKGTLSNEPEVELETRTKEEQQKPRERKRLEDSEHTSVKATSKAKASKEAEVEQSAKSNLQNDDFFAA